MQDLTDDERKQVLGEVLFDEFKALREGISALPTREEFKEMAAKVDQIADDMTVVKQVAKDHSRQLQDQDIQLTEVKATLQALGDAV